MSRRETICSERDETERDIPLMNLLDRWESPHQIQEDSRNNWAIVEAEEVQTILNRSSASTVPQQQAVSALPAQVLAVIASAQLEDFLAMAQLHITSQAGGGVPLVGVFCLLAQGGILFIVLHPLPRGADGTSPHHKQIFLVTKGQVKHPNGQGMPALPTGQSPQTFNHGHVQLASIPVPHLRFAHIHVDLVGLLPPSHGHTYLFTVIDRTSWWPEAIPLSSITKHWLLEPYSPAGSPALECHP